MDWHTIPLQTIYSTTESSPDGLTATQAEAKLAINGLNELQIKKKKTALKLFLAQFKDFMIIVLMVAAVVSGIIGDLTDSIVIVVILILNAIIGFVQEYRAEKSMEALQKLAAPEAAVVRDGQLKSISAAQLVPGDLVILNAGDAVPADLRLTESHFLQIDEASLTGESIPRDKYAQWSGGKTTNSIGDRLNMAYKDTLITRGRGSGIVIATGMDTEIGQIATMLHEDEPLTPLQRRLADFGRKLSYAILVICTLLFLLGLWQGEEVLKMLLTAISVAVAAIPEALPAVVTITLALGAKRLIKQNALIRKLPAVETLGSVTYICSDKTGTITENKMKVQKAIPYPSELKLSTDYSVLDYAMILNNDVKKSGRGNWKGDPTELAMFKHAEITLGSGYVSSLVNDFTRVAEIPFDPDRKCMTTVHNYGQRFLAISKGAVEVIISKLKDKSQADVINRQTQELAERGMRVLAFGYRLLNEVPNSSEINQIENNLSLAGLVGLIDPPRPEVKAAIAQCKTAGIRPVMITGDHPVTAMAIAKDIDLWSPDGLLVTGQDLQSLTQNKLDEVVEKIAVYARVNPEQKLNIVRSLQRKKHFVAMTGDGVNDAPSLRIANIGIAMGIMGTEVSKEASHMVLLDDNFATIVQTVKEGRHIFDNIRKFIKYTMTSNSGELWTILLAPLLGLPIPLLPIHILWINLVTDGLPGLALIMEPAEKDLMNKPPRSPSESIFSRGMGKHILWVGLLMGFVCLGLQYWTLEFEVANWQTMVFTVLCLSQLGHVFAIRSECVPIIKYGLVSNRALIWSILLTFTLQMGTIYLPAANAIFKTAPLSLNELLVCFAASLVVFHAVEFEKWFKSKKVR